MKPDEVESSPMSFESEHGRPEDRDRVHRMLGRARILLEILKPISLDPSRIGGQLACTEVITSPDLHTELLTHCIMPVGGMTVDQAKTYYLVAKQGARRLYEHLTKGHLPINQSTSHDLPSGAIHGRPWILCFQGLEGYDNEALVLNLMIWEKLLTPEDAFLVAAGHENRQFKKLYEFCIQQALFTRI